MKIVKELREKGVKTDLDLLNRGISKSMKYASSYKIPYVLFVGEDELYKEDKGFALAPWEKIRFENKGFLFEKNRSIAMGNYYFKAVNSNEEIKVEYTFGYCMGSDGNLKIDLHHSSLPYRC